jgi:hypothetical protein
MTTVTVKRFIKNFAHGGCQHYSIRRREDGSFQLYHDDPYLGIPQFYEFDYEQISGRYADVRTAEAELLRIHPDLEVEAS